MDQSQVRKTVRTLRRELDALDLQRGTLAEAIASLERLLPPEEGSQGQLGGSQSGRASERRKYPGLTAGILQVIEEGEGRPVPVGKIRDAFDQRGWLVSSEGQDRSKTIYETLRRLKTRKRVHKRGNQGYVLPTEMDS